MRTEFIGNQLPVAASTSQRRAFSQERKTSPVEEVVSSFEKSIQQANAMQHEADQAIEALATGEVKDIAQTMIAVEKANLSFQLMTQVRNRIVEAYQEVMRMQV